MVHYGCLCCFISHFVSLHVIMSHYVTLRFIMLVFVSYTPLSAHLFWSCANHFRWDICVVLSSGKGNFVAWWLICYDCPRKWSGLTRQTGHLHSQTFISVSYRRYRQVIIIIETVNHSKSFQSFWSMSGVISLSVGTPIINSFYIALVREITESWNWHLDVTRWKKIQDDYWDKKILQ